MIRGRRTGDIQHDVYVDYIDGQYFLIDPEHPGPRLMINVVIYLRPRRWLQGSPPTAA